MSLRSAHRPIEERWAEFWRRYDAGRWEPETRELLRQTLHSGDLFVDIGAWIGPVTLWALECGAEVIAIEPDPVAAKELRRNVGEKVEIWEGAVAPERGKVRIAPRGDLGNSMTRVSESGYLVEAWPLSDILGDRVPALVKVDIEGYETELLPTLAPFLARLRASLAVALHDAMPDPEWFAGFEMVEMPSAPRLHGRSTQVVAR